jgi:hypothetical protein
MTTMALRRRALSFSSFISEERQINTHMDHIEDAVFLSGVSGARSAINYLQNLRNMLAGHAAAAVNVTVKFDGAPAIIAGTDPSDGKFFVAKKGIFNKNPKVYKTDADINADTSGDLATKLKMALKHFSKLGIENVVQGDLLFTADTVNRQTIDGEDYLTFQPNTIVYAVPVKSALGRKIAAAEIGVVWHTTYTGDSFDTMSASFGKSISDKLKQTRGVWHSDATFKDQSGLATMTQAETEQVTAILSSAGKLLKTIPASVLNDIYNNEDLQLKIMTYNNTKVRAGERVSNPAAHVTSLMHYIHDYYQKQVDQKKTEKGKSVQVDKRKAALKYFTDHSKADIVKVFELMNLFVDAKEIIIKKLNTVSALKTMLSTSTGFKVTTPEGYVAIDHLGKAVKLVDRLEFSRANFSADVKKGWQR